MTRTHALRLCSTLAALLAITVQAQDLTVETYVPPTPLQRDSPEYPADMIQTNREAWVEVNFMVDTEGKPFELMVTESTGPQSFGKAAMDAIEDWRYAPAERGGEPITGSVKVRFNFTIQEARAARSTFATRYRSFFRAVRRGDEEKIKSALDHLVAAGAVNHYENALLAFANFMYAKDHEDTLTQMDYLKAALSYTTSTADSVYLGEAEARFARVELLRTQLLNKYFADALRTYAYFYAVGDEEVVTQYKQVIDNIRTLEHSGPAFSVPLTLSPSGSTYMLLFKHHVYVQNVVGKVAEFKLRCTAHYIGFEAEPDVSYDVPAEWGACDLEVIGDAGTTFELVQH